MLIISQYLKCSGHEVLPYKGRSILLCLSLSPCAGLSVSPQAQAGCLKLFEFIFLIFRIGLS